MNNKLSNIWWGTHSDVMQSRSRNGYDPAIGEGHGSSRLTNESVLEMRRLQAEAPEIWTYSALSKKFHVTKKTAFMAVTRATWRHI